MTTAEMRVALAEACGFTNISTACWRGHQDGYERRVPDYPSDLNACHEAEGMLLKDAQTIATWEQHIRNITLRDGREGSGLYERIIRATAPQRCEALLRTLGKWQEPPTPAK